MTRHRILFDKRYIKELAKIPKSIQESIRQKVQGLVDNPRPEGSLKLQGSKKSPLYRIRCGDYRVIYTVKDEVLIVLVVDVGYRRNIYL